MYRFEYGKYVCFVEIVRMFVKKKSRFSVIGRGAQRKACLPISEKNYAQDTRTTICGDSTSWA